MEYNVGNPYGKQQKQFVFLNEGQKGGSTQRDLNVLVHTSPKVNMQVATSNLEEKRDVGLHCKKILAQRQSEKLIKMLKQNADRFSTL